MTHPKRFSRRQFLKTSSLLGTAAFLQACQLFGRGSAPPVSQVSTSIPTATNTPSATTTASATTMPSATAPSEVATATVAPTATVAQPVSPIFPTPTPTSTPYPPGPPSKLGLFLTRFHPQVIEIIKQGKPPLIKTLELDPNFGKGIKELAPNTILVGRLFQEQQLNLDADPLPLARQFVADILPIATEPTRMAYFDAWEGPNEPVADTVEKMKRLADFEAERTRLLGERGIRSVIGNFATGHPDLPLWPHFEPALAAARQYNGYLGIHEYSAPVMQYLSGGLQPNGGDEGDEGWLTLRYRKAHRQFLQPMGYGDLPILITECGVDGLVANRPGPPDAKGWQDFVGTWLDNGLRNDPPGVYMDQLIWYDEELRKDDYIKGATIFLAGASPGWETYDILGRTGDLLQQYLEAHPQP
ncbi:MAG: hypothetical protein AAF629_06835 [Chloroflexota bacterium]